MKDNEDWKVWLLGLVLILVPCFCIWQACTTEPSIEHPLLFGSFLGIICDLGILGMTAG